MYNEEKTYRDGIAGIIQRISNFWYHNKSALIISIVGLFVLAVILYQCTSRIPPDADVMYAGPLDLGVINQRQLQEAFDEILGVDLNGDGRIHVGLTVFYYVRSVLISENDRQIVDNTFNPTVRQQIDLEVMTGDSVIFLLSPEIYANLRERDVLMPLSEALGSMPAAAVDAYSIRLSALEVYETTALSGLPEDTLIAVRAHRTANPNTEALERHSRGIILLRNMLG